MRLGSAAVLIASGLWSTAGSAGTPSPSPQDAPASAESPRATGLIRPRICVVLSGGGARGMAHIGVLKVLEELKVPIDCIAGTSMGAVIGGLYASGMTAAQIDETIRSVDWQEAFRDSPPRRELTFRRKQDDRNFLVRLPLAQARLTERPLSLPTPAVFTAPLPKRRIVVVDDTRAALYTLARLLETMGQHVLTADNAASALELIHSERPDLVISDLAMPNMNGYELAQHVREDPAIADLVLVALTGYGQESNRRRAREAGFDDYLVKPVSLEALQKLLASLPALRAASGTAPERPDSAML